MKLKDIYEEFLNGKKIRRKSWKEGSWVNINNITVLGKESLTAEDWEIVEEKEIKERIVNENRVYKCIKDYQLSPLVDPEEGFCMGLTKTVREWRTAALEWSDCGDFIEDTEIKLHELTGQELMDYISVIWEIGFEEVKEIKLKN